MKLFLLVFLSVISLQVFGFGNDQEFKPKNNLILNPGLQVDVSADLDMQSNNILNAFFDADLNFLSNVENADIKVGANIARSKMANGTANYVLINNGSGVFSEEQYLNRTRGGTGITSTATFPSSGVIVTTTATQTLTNKTYSGGRVIGSSATTFNQWTPPSGTTAFLTGLCPSLNAGALLYSTDEFVYYLCDGATITEIGSGSGGGGGSTISEWIPFPAVTTWDTILGVHNSFYRRVGGDMEITFNSNLTVNPSTSPLTSFFIDLPIGYTIDLTQMRVDQDVGDGAMLASMSAAGTFKLDVMIGGPTSVYSTDVWDHIAGIGQISNQITDVFNYNFGIAPGIDFVQFTYRFPVNEWAASIPPLANGNFFHETVQPQNMLTVSARINHSGAAYFISGSDSTGLFWLDSVATNAVGSSTMVITAGTFLNPPTCTVTPHTILAIPSFNGIGPLPFVKVLTYSASTLSGINTGYDIICTGEKAP